MNKNKFGMYEIVNLTLFFTGLIVFGAVASYNTESSTKQITTTRTAVQADNEINPFATAIPRKKPVSGINK